MTAFTISAVLTVGFAIAMIKYGPDPVIGFFKKILRYFRKTNKP